MIATDRGRILQHSGSNRLWYMTTMVVLSEDAQRRYTFVFATNRYADAIETVIEPVIVHAVARHRPLRNAER